MYSLRTLSWSTTVEFYDHLTLHIVPGPRSLSYFVPFLLIVAALTTPPQVLSRWQTQWLVLPLVYAVQFYVWLYYKSFDVISMNGALLAFMLLGWYDVRRDFRHVKRLQPDRPWGKGTANGTNKAGAESRQGEPTNKSEMNGSFADHDPPFLLESYPSTLAERLHWVVLLLSSMRLTDWRVGLPQHDSRQPGPIKHFTDFVLETIAQAIFAYVLLDLTTPYMVASACHSATVTGMPSNDLLSQIIRSLVLLVYFYAALGLLTAFLPHLISVCALIVAPSLRLSPVTSPLTWPGHFGPLSSIYLESSTTPTHNRGLRAFWGVFWHQNMRFITSTPGVALASSIGIRRGSKLRYMTVVISSFVWSGIVHMGVIPPEPIGTRYTCTQMRLRIASFFWVQCVGIGLEDTVDSIYRARRLKAVNHVKPDDLQQTIPCFKSRAYTLLLQAGIMLWTVGFLAVTAWWTILPVGCEMGWFKMSLVPASIFQFLPRI